MIDLYETDFPGMYMTEDGYFVDTDGSLYDEDGDLIEENAVVLNEINTDPIYDKLSKRQTHDVHKIWDLEDKYDAAKKAGNEKLASKYYNILKKREDRIYKTRTTLNNIPYHQITMNERKAKGLIKQGSTNVEKPKFLLRTSSGKPMTPADVEDAASWHKKLQYNNMKKFNWRVARDKKRGLRGKPAKNPPAIIPSTDSKNVFKDTVSPKTKHTNTGSQTINNTTQPKSVKKGNKIIGYIKKHPGKSAAIAAGTAATVYGVKKAYDHYKNKNSLI